MFKETRTQLDRLRAKRRSLYESQNLLKDGDLLSFYVRIMTKVSDAERCSIFIHDPEGGRVWLKAGTGLQEHEIEVPKEGSVVGKVIASGEPITESGLEKKEGAHKATDEKTGFVTRSILCVPIKSPTRNEVTGAFQLLNKKGAEGFTDEDMSLAQEIAGHLQMEVDKIFLDQEIFGLAERLYAAARKAVAFVAICLVVFFAAVIFVMLAWGVVPGLLG